MSIHLKRETGIMGSANVIALKVNGSLEKKLANNETHVIEGEGESVEIQAKQWFFGSGKKEVKTGGDVTIKTNGAAVLFLFIFLILGIVGRSIHPTLVYIGFAGIILTGIYAVKHWFRLEIE